MKNLLIATLAFITIASHADTFVYTQAYTETTTGYGSVHINKWTGYLFFDEEGGFIEINANAKSKTYTVRDFSSYTWNFYYPKVGAGSTMVIALQPDGDFATFYAKGTAAPTTVGLGTRTIAKTLTLCGSAIGVDGVNDVLIETKGKLVFSSADSNSATVAFPGVQATLGYIKGKLSGQGYTELQ